MKWNTFLKRYLSCCKLCPKNCGVNRFAGERGFCGAGLSIKVARAALHFWEEPCISGDVGSGTVFFSHCTLRCIYCQNYQISTQQVGKEIGIERLCEIFLQLQQQKAANINLVTPTHYIPQICLALQLAKQQGLSIPIVYNSSGYEQIEALNLLDGLIDIYLPDFKYYDNTYAMRFSHAADYRNHTVKAIHEMIKQVKDPIFLDGMMKKGVIVRHLMLPGLLEDSKQIIKLIRQQFEDHVYLSLMNQYTPLQSVKHIPQLNTRLDPLDYDDAVSYALSLGIHQGFIQESETATESFIPDFDQTGI